MACCIFIAWQRKCSKKNGEPEMICVGSRLPAQAMEFMESVGIDVAWTVDGDRSQTATNQASIITKMVLNQIGKKRYNLGQNFLGSTKEGKATYRLIMRLKPPPNQTSQDYENQLHEALLKKIAFDLRVHVESEVEKGLMLELAKIKKLNLKLENNCKRLVIENVKLKGNIRTKARDRNIRDLTRELKAETKNIKDRIRTNKNNRQFEEDWSEVDYCREKLDELKAERDEEEGRMINGMTNTMIQKEKVHLVEETQVTGRKRQRVEEIPKKTADQLRQDQLMAMTEEDYFRVE